MRGAGVPISCALTLLPLIPHCAKKALENVGLAVKFAISASSSEDEREVGKLRGRYRRSMLR